MISRRYTFLVLAGIALLGAAHFGLIPAESLLFAPVVFGTVSFDSVPTGIRMPFVTAEFNNSRASRGPALLPYRALIIGQKTSGGAWTANGLYKATSVEQVIAGAGRGSLLHRQALAWFKVNQFTETWFGVLADHGSGVAASGTLTVTASSAVAGVLHFMINGVYVPVSVASAAAQNDIATAIGAAITAAADLPVSASVTDNVVTVTAKSKGTHGNNIDMRLNYQDGQATPSGVAVAIVAMASGATNPVLTSLIAAMGDNWYQVIVHPYTDSTNLGALETELASRFGPTRQIDGVLVTSAAGTHSTLTTLGGARNSPHSIIAAQPGKNPLTHPVEYAAAVGAVLAYFGNIDPARPFQTLPLPGVLPPAEGDRFTFSESNLQLHDGISTARVTAGGEVVLSRVITTYQAAASGAADVSYLDATTMLTLLYLRYAWRTAVQNTFPRHKLASDGVRYSAGQAVVTPTEFKAFCLTWFRQMEDLGLVENFDQFKRDLVVERNVTDVNRLDVVMMPDLVNQFIVGAASFRFVL